jgi:TPR repeat protein
LLLGAVLLLPACRDEQTKSAEQPSAPIPAQDCDRLAQLPDMGPRYPGSGVEFEEVDGKAAQEACERAIREYPGEARFKVWLGRALQRLNRVDEALVLYRQTADRGDAAGQISLGDTYFEGRGVPQSDTEAMRWFRLAAVQGNASAQVVVGFMYEDGRGVPQSDTEAVKWYRLAADQENEGGQIRLGFMYLKGRGVPQNETEAEKWFRRSAKLGNQDAQNVLESSGRSSP